MPAREKQEPYYYLLGAFGIAISPVLESLEVPTVGIPIATLLESLGITRDPYRSCIGILAAHREPYCSPLGIRNSWGSIGSLLSLSPSLVKGIGMPRIPVGIPRGLLSPRKNP